MLIGEFSKTSGLPTDTVRFYVRKGLLTPRSTAKGGRNPYMVFSTQHVQDAQMIRMGQLLGLSLKDIDRLLREVRIVDASEALTHARHVRMITDQLVRLEERVAELTAMGDYLRRKRAWIEGGQQGAEPRLPTGASAGCSGMGT